MPKTIIISLGGSLIVPNEIDIKFLNGFKKIISAYIKKGIKFVIICGGGKTARKYQEAASELAEVDNEGLDWIGIMATRLNAQLLKVMLRDYAEKCIVYDPTEKIIFKKNILIAAGWNPGWSTDYDAVLIAKQLNAKEILNLSNIDYVYDKDPRYKSAKPIKNISWENFRAIIGNSWQAGLNLPFDPIAAKEAEKLKIRVVIIGKDLDNFENYLNKNDFKGTIIS